MSLKMNCMRSPEQGSFYYYSKEQTYPRPQNSAVWNEDRKPQDTPKAASENHYREGSASVHGIKKDIS